MWIRQVVSDCCRVDKGRCFTMGISLDKKKLVTESRSSAYGEVTVADFEKFISNKEVDSAEFLSKDLFMAVYPFLAVYPILSSLLTSKVRNEPLPQMREAMDEAANEAVNILSKKKSSELIELFSNFVLKLAAIMEKTGEKTMAMELFKLNTELKKRRNPLEL